MKPFKGTFENNQQPLWLTIPVSAFLVYLLWKVAGPLYEVLGKHHGHLPGVGLEPFLYKHKLFLITIALLVFWQRLAPGLLQRLLLAVILATTLLFSSDYRFFKVTVLLLFICQLSLMFYLNVVRPKNLQATAKNVYTSVYSTLVCLLVLELVFMFLPQSHGVGYTLGSRLWDSYYWKPQNHLGYRDTEPGQRDSSKTKVFVIGDSFTAGHGIKHAGDRFSNLLEKNLQDASVYNLGVNGADTPAEYQHLVNYPLTPDMVVLQYFANDIEGALRQHAKFFEGFKPYDDAPQCVRPLVEGSHLLNFIYWQFPHGDATPYMDLMLSGYRQTEILKTQLDELSHFVTYAKTRSIPLYVVVFPMMQSPVEDSEFYVKPISDFFRQHEVPVLDVSGLVKNMPINERMVNMNDAHPNEKVHELVGMKLAEMIRKKNALVQ